MHATGPSRGPSNFRGARPAIAIAVLLVAAGVAINMSGAANAQERSGSAQEQVAKAKAKAKAIQANASNNANDDDDDDDAGNGGNNNAGANGGNNNNAGNDDDDDNAAAGNNAGNNNNNKAGNNNTGKKKAGANGQAGAANGQAAALKPLATDCDKTKLQLHTGFQDAPRCVNTSFGEVSAADDNPTLLITKAPNQVNVGDAFTITVSTRNLVRDRFLAAAQGGYYLETSLLNADGLTRGHFHSGCRMLDSTSAAPEPDEVPAFFKATEDGKGGAQPDSVVVEIPDGLPETGTAQCAVWAGDGSHRIPMMQRANQIPAFDSVRIKVNN